MSIERYRPDGYANPRPVWADRGMRDAVEWCVTQINDLHPDIAAAFSHFCTRWDAAPADATEAVARCDHPVHRCRAARAGDARSSI